MWMSSQSKHFLVSDYVDSSSKNENTVFYSPTIPNLFEVCHKSWWQHFYFCPVSFFLCLCFVFFHQWWIRPVFTADLWALVGNRGLMVLNSCTSSPCFSQTTQISSVEKGKFKSFPLIRFPINLMNPVPVYHPFSDPFCVFFCILHKISKHLPKLQSLIG